MNEIKCLQVKVESVEAVIEYVQNIMLHRYWLWAYDLESLDSFDLMGERNLKTKIKYLINKGYTRVSDSVKMEDKLVGICRDFCLLSVEILRYNNIETRARCGFSSYLTRGSMLIIGLWNTKMLAE